MDDDEITRDAFRAARGDRMAAERFVAATRHQLHRLLGYLSSPALAEDLVQETYLRAFAALPGYEGRSPARMWLLAIAKRVAADQLRVQGRRPRAGRTEDWVAQAEQHGATAPDHGRLVVLRRLVGELELERREAFVLTQVAGLSYAEAAELCGCAVGTIRSRVFRAREDLTAALREGQRRAAHG
ncbi:sigma-70 family RNA polymerase sigma factor [Amycolatopsis rhizosphaerae]|uniref:Sigma-70 family RNA polymerase sigma factor n=1 Tax=Amycolatopsis rhizosphaerae TaxID=2053003 RepID=A0A558D9A3_9PSEU|nr:sigma-70 family RNA polymerase sigma factor [Amycolatopsis rhizosphaerae]TVT57607.1 sigma-70 family RNA polymerase sigma factor [Amycolatopsis rhizosphaerae]